MEEKILRAKAAAEAAAVPIPKVLKRDLYEATLEARDVVEIGRQKAQEILRDAERQRESIFEQAQQEGYAKGLAEWNEALVRAAEHSENLARDSEQQLLRLSVRIAEKIIGGQLKLHPETIVEIVREALKSVQRGRQLMIQVNEAQASEVRERIARLKELVGSSREIEIVPSTSVSPGGCVIESELGVIDARLETQLKCIEEMLIRESRK